MPSEPDNKIDNLLKTYARKRRDEAGAPVEMHPATRRLLQAEAAKLKPAAAPTTTSWLNALMTFWPRVAFAAGILIVAGIAAVTFLMPANQKEKAMQLARRDTTTPADDRNAADEQVGGSRRALAPVPAKPAGKATVALQDQVSSSVLVRRESKALPDLLAAGESDSEEVAKKLKAVDVAQNEPRNNVAMNRVASRAVATPPAAPAPSASEPVQLGAVVAQSTDKTGRAAGGPPAPAPKTLTIDPGYPNASDSKQVDALALSLKEEKPPAQQFQANEAGTGSYSKAPAQQQPNSTTTRSRFANVQQASRQNLGKASAAEATVLANFVVEQSGEQLRVVDADGSVYDGKVLSAEPAVAGDYEIKLNYDAGTRRDAARPALTQAVKDSRTKQSQSDPAAASAWNFRVSGTNRTLQQPVIVDGILFETAATNALNQAGANVANGSLQFYRLAPGQAPAQQRSYGVSSSTVQNSAASSLNQSTHSGQSMNLLNARRIQGQVRVGATNQLPLDAVRDGNSP